MSQSSARLTKLKASSIPEATKSIKENLLEGPSTVAVTEFESVNLEMRVFPSYYVCRTPSRVAKKELPISLRELHGIVEELKSDDVQKILARLRPKELNVYQKKATPWNALVAYHAKNLTRKLTPTVPITSGGYNLVELALQYGAINVLTKLLEHSPEVQELVKKPYNHFVENAFRSDVSDTWMNLLIEKNSSHLKAFEEFTGFKWSNSLQEALSSRNAYRIHRQLSHLQCLKPTFFRDLSYCLQTNQFHAYETALRAIIELPKHTPRESEFKYASLSSALLALAHLPHVREHSFFRDPATDTGMNPSQMYDWAEQQLSKIEKASDGFAKLITTDNKPVAPQFAFHCFSSIHLTDINPLQDWIFYKIPTDAYLGQTDKENGLGLAAYAVAKHNSTFALKALNEGLYTQSKAHDLSECLIQAVAQENLPLMQQLLDMGADPEQSLSRTTRYEFMDIPSENTFTESALAVAARNPNRSMHALLKTHMVKHMTQTLSSMRPK